MVRRSHPPNLRLLSAPGRAPAPGLRELRTPRQAAAVALRRARCATGLPQVELAVATGSHERTVRRREKGQVDLGLLEEAMRHPRFAAALGRELIAAAERMANSAYIEEFEVKEAA